MESIKKTRQYFDIAVQCSIRYNVDVASKCNIARSKEIGFKDRSGKSNGLTMKCKISTDGVEKQAKIPVLYDKQLDSYYVELQPNQTLVDTCEIVKYDTKGKEDDLWTSLEYDAGSIFFNNDMKDLLDYAEGKVKYKYDETSETISPIYTHESKVKIEDQQKEKRNKSNNSFMNASAAPAPIYQPKGNYNKQSNNGNAGFQQIDAKKKNYLKK